MFCLPVAAVLGAGGHRRVPQHLQAVAPAGPERQHRRAGEKE